MKLNTAIHVENNMSSQRDFKYYTANGENERYLGGTSIQSLKEFNVSKADLDMYLPIDPNKVNDATKGIQIHYLGYYLKWHPQKPITMLINTVVLRLLQSGRQEHIANTILLTIKLMTFITLRLSSNLA